MAEYDHFHCVFEIDGQEGEIEGGLPLSLDSIRNLSDKELEDWKYAKAVGWGMPEGAVIKKFWLAG